MRAQFAIDAPPAQTEAAPGEGQAGIDEYRASGGGEAGEGLADESGGLTGVDGADPKAEAAGKRERLKAVGADKRVATDGPGAFEIDATPGPLFDGEGAGGGAERDDLPIRGVDLAQKGLIGSGAGGQGFGFARGLFAGEGIEKRGGPGIGEKDGGDDDQ